MKTKLTQNIEKALCSYRPAKLGELHLNYMRKQYMEFEVPVTHSHIEDGLVDAVWLAEGYANHELNYYCHAPYYLQYSDKLPRENTCALTEDEIKSIGTHTRFKCNNADKCSYKFSVTDKDEAVAIVCFEIKISKADFHSRNGHNFIGNLNYYVMPYELYKTVKDEIPEDIGCITYHYKTEDEVGRLKHQKASKYTQELNHPLYSSLLLTFMNKRSKRDYKMLCESTRKSNDLYDRACSVISQLIGEQQKLTEFPSCYQAGWSYCEGVSTVEGKCADCCFSLEYKQRYINEIRGNKNDSNIL